ncbi:hypothetical protein AMS68_000173 [Peltaster fructicola]|uniref:Cyanate lyase C-terminal domain-containing protein n=1 Tax=Peltaster fructicola TaxID=286661 RepID=A0A6H0XIW2_9PEZI|nr:hypothetical protein AMS68_000173 [Peltaster fructicola]
MSQQGTSSGFPIATLDTTIAQRLPASSQILFAAKKEKNLSFETISKALGREEVACAALFYGHAQANDADIANLSKLLDIPEETLRKTELQNFPDRARAMEMPPKEPLVYRLYEIVQNYGYAYKAILNEKFGDGIMSAISFSTTVKKETDEKGSHSLDSRYRSNAYPSRDTFFVTIEVVLSAADMVASLTEHNHENAFTFRKKEVNSITRPSRPSRKHTLSELIDLDNLNPGDLVESPSGDLLSLEAARLRPDRPPSIRERQERILSRVRDRRDSNVSVAPREIREIAGPSPLRLKQQHMSVKGQVESAVTPTQQHEGRMRLADNAPEEEEQQQQQQHRTASQSKRCGCLCQ